MSYRWYVSFKMHDTEPYSFWGEAETHAAALEKLDKIIAKYRGAPICVRIRRKLK